MSRTDNKEQYLSNCANYCYWIYLCIVFGVDVLRLDDQGTSIFLSASRVKQIAGLNRMGNYVLNAIASPVVNCW